ncbi:acireductone synthase [Kaistia algarum]|uniref:acireductone synthase n=1 Tax=Kaistia algarum TaxID=2083279 RepID=UPI000CE907C2|nr:acireductone synthase [Kaistia algarum]MCX5514946.1 acireductone synthase [Kaistia algarum]PPE79693.1 acireductone synthase [Kaistia algarum]
MSANLVFEPDVVLLDIEGTIASQPYVTAVLYSYLRDNLKDYVAAHHDDPVVQQILADTVTLAGEPCDPIETLLGWLAEDRKAPPLKKIQGMVWVAGFEAGRLQGHIYDDALAMLKLWHEAGVPLFVFSSGSVLSQTLFFANIPSGDLRPLFSGHYDTDIGAKVETESYRKIAGSIGVDPTRLLFFSDNPRELAAATAAGLPVVHVVREEEGTKPDPRFQAITSFEEVELRRWPTAS